MIAYSLIASKKIRNGIETNIDIPCFDLIHAYTLLLMEIVQESLLKSLQSLYVVAVRNTDVNDFSFNATLTYTRCADYA